MAARGVFALAMFDRQAARYFNFSRSGLVSSFIAVLAVAAFELVVSALLGQSNMFESLVQTVIVYAALIASTWLFARQIDRMDAMVPFIVTINWSNAALSLAMMVTVLVGLGLIAPVLMGAAVIVTINIARLIMTLKALQIVLLILAQVVGLVAAVLVLGMMFPLTEEEQAQLERMQTELSSPQQ
ncbi:hypothetical protein [Devosia sp.]|uniref:hypothetical protein n=1 Tax=Devosia sp. TaxID=1871048 RepID=UPI003A90F7D1